jgi:hypothetical protein
VGLGLEVLGLRLRRLPPWPGRVRIEAAADGQDHFPHSRRGKNAPLSGQQRTLAQDLHEMSFEKRRPGQPSLSRRKLHDGCPFGSAAAHWDDENGFGPFAEIPLIERNHQHPMADGRVPEIRGPDLSPSR